MLKNSQSNQEEIQKKKLIFGHCHLIRIWEVGWAYNILPHHALHSTLNVLSFEINTLTLLNNRFTVPLTSVPQYTHTHTLLQRIQYFELVIRWHWEYLTSFRKSPFDCIVIAVI